MTKELREIDSLEAGHDIVYDYCCTLCANDNLNAEAFYYCKVCSKLYCNNCLKQHNRFLTGHLVLGREDISKWSTIKNTTISVMWDAHTGKELELYCSDHDLVCCHMCVSTNHRLCKEVKYLPEVAAGIFQIPEFQSLQSTPNTILTRLANLRDKKKVNKTVLQKACERIKRNFQDMRKKINHDMDKLERDTTKEMERLVSILDKGIQAGIDSTTDIHDKILTLLDTMKKLGDESEHCAFASYKKYKQHFQQAEKLLATLKDEDFQLDFIPNGKIENFLSSMKTLGQLQVIPNLPLPEDHVYSITNKQSIRIRTKDDKSECLVSGICQLQNGQTVIVDSSNNKVKLLDLGSFSVISELKMPPTPQDICYTKGTEMAVTVCDWTDCESDRKIIRKFIQFINITHGQFVKTRTIRMHHSCRSISCRENQLYVGSDNTLFVYDFFGQLQNQISQDGATKHVFSRFCVSYDGDRIYVTTTDNSLLTLDRKGRQLAAATSQEMNGTSGICVTGTRSLFVAGRVPGTILQIEYEGKRKMAQLTTQKDKTWQAWSMCFDRKTQQLLAGQENNDYLLLFSLK